MVPLLIVTINLSYYTKTAYPQETMPTDKELDIILNDWGVRGTSERWSLKAMFVRDSTDNSTIDDFIRFLEEKLGASRNPDKRRS